MGVVVATGAVFGLAGARRFALGAAFWLSTLTGGNVTGSARTEQGSRAAAHTVAHSAQARRFIERLLGRLDQSE
jgi:hypothetical protein